MTGRALAIMYSRARAILRARGDLTMILSFTVGTSLFIQVITVASGVILARALGPEGRGALALAMLWPTLVAGLGLLGISDAVVYRAARENERPSAALSNALPLAIIQSLLLSVAGWLLIRIALHGKPTVAADADFYLWYIPLNLLGIYAIAYLQGRMAMSYFNLFRASVHVAYTVLLALLWVSNHVNVRTALAASLLSNLITVGLCAASLVRAGVVALRVSVSELRSLITLGLQLNLGNLASVFASRIDIVMLSFLVTPSALGDYVVATTVGALPFLLPSAVSLILYPLFARQQREKAGRAFSRFMLLAILLTLAGIPVVLMISPLVVKVFFGSAFSPAIVIGQILSVASLLRGMNTMLGSVLRGLGAPMRASGGDIAGLTVMAITLVPGIRLAQGEGAAVASLLGAATALTWMTYQSLRVVRLSPSDLIHWWKVELRSGVTE